MECAEVVAWIDGCRGDRIGLVFSRENRFGSVPIKAAACWIEATAAASTALAMRIALHRPLEVGDRVENMEHESTRRRGRVQTHGQGAQVGALGFEDSSDVPSIKSGALKFSQ